MSFKRNCGLVLLIFVIHAAIFLGVQAWFVGEHEQAHAAIGTRFGCEEYTIRTGWFSGEYRCVSMPDLRPGEYDVYRLGQKLNDVVGYHLNPFILLFCLLSFVHFVRDVGRE